MDLTNFFDAEYFERGEESGKSCYNNYHWRPDITIPLATNLLEILRPSFDSKILDFGCAKGFLVHTLRFFGYNAYGADISKYAITCCPPEVRDFLFLLDNNRSNQQLQTLVPFDFVIAKDVLEHIPYEDIDSTIEFLRSITTNLFVAVPLGNSFSYFIPSYGDDKSHFICQDINWWIQRFINNGFKIKYVSDSLKGIKTKWDHISGGNGFFLMS